METSPRVLVAYATAAGSTAAVAERMAGVIAEPGNRTVCAPVGREVDPLHFDAVVVGSAVHNMAWLPPAVEFLDRAAASGRPVWCFSVGGLAKPYAGRLSRRMATGELRRVERQFPPDFVPRDHRLFAGVVESAGAPLWARLFYRLTGSGPGDHREWPAIDSWARTVTADLARVDGSQDPGRQDLGHSAAAAPPADPRP